jgi:hypothetical protein
MRKCFICMENPSSVDTTIVFLNHLFPRMPRHKLRSIQPFVLRLCNKHGLTYSFFYMIIVLCEMVKLAHKAESIQPSLGK